ncbi:MAG: AAA family ATPase [Candidatus Kerfeldbacteria bacterium]|nr:AAA family ATPase [Candidatus Kerfeldbacteria bacterium]
MERRQPFIIGLSGGSGSGKTTLADILKEALPWKVSVVALDRFYKNLDTMPLAERKLTNFDHPDSLDLEQFTNVIKELSEGRATSVPIYDFAECNPTREREAVAPAEVILVEGMQILDHTPLLRYLDMRIFLNIDEQTRFQRKVERDMRERGRTYADVLDMWHTRTKPMHGLYVQPGMMNADLVFTQSFGPQVLEVVTKEIHRRMNMWRGEHIDEWLK